MPLDSLVCIHGGDKLKPVLEKYDEIKQQSERSKFSRLSIGLNCLQHVKITAIVLDVCIKEILDPTKIIKGEAKVQELCMYI